MKQSLVALLAVLLASAIAGVEIAAQESAVVVDIRDFSFEPHEVKVTTGSTVRWVNRDQNVHSIAMEGGRPGSSGIIEPDKEHAVTFRDAGQFTYRCGIHPTMLGIVVVD